MQPGDLVRITRASIGVPKDTIGLIVKAREHDDVGDVYDISRADKVYTLETHGEVHSDRVTSLAVIDVLNNVCNHLEVLSGQCPLLCSVDTLIIGTGKRG